MTTITDIRPLFPSATTPNSKNNARKSRTGQVDLSETATVMSEAEDLAMNGSDIDEARVKEIQQAIERGELTINYDRLAQKMLEFEFSLFDE